jgi:hypothetical protein
MSPIWKYLLQNVSPMDAVIGIQQGSAYEATVSGCARLAENLVADLRKFCPD